MERCHLKVSLLLLLLRLQSEKECGDNMANVNDGSNKLQFYSYWVSSCSCRVRIGLNLKGLQYEYKAVNLMKGEQHTPEFRKLNPIGYVPALVDRDFVLSDSFAILMAYLFLAPQIHAAINRFNVDMTKYPLLLRLHEAYCQLLAFQNAMPENQPDSLSS